MRIFAVNIIYIYIYIAYKIYRNSPIVSADPSARYPEMISPTKQNKKKAPPPPPPPPASQSSVTLTPLTATTQESMTQRLKTKAYKPPAYKSINENTERYDWNKNKKKKKVMVEISNFIY